MSAGVPTTAADIAAGVRSGAVRAADVIDEHLARIAAREDEIHAFNLQRDDFHAMIDGMAMDAVEDICAPDEPTLDLFCDRVASAAGRLSVRIFGMPEAEGIKLSHPHATLHRQQQGGEEPAGHPVGAVKTTAIGYAHAL